MYGLKKRRHEESLQKLFARRCHSPSRTAGCYEVPQVGRMRAGKVRRVDAVSQQNTQRLGSSLVIDAGILVSAGLVIPLEYLFLAAC